jgi:vanillate O-demethylase ferredoxin subunit
VLAGTPDHRDSFLTPREKTCGKTMMLCCSGSLTPELVLDLDC